ncbi:type II secretion system protein GspC [Colwellia sp. MSW7]|uniref:Type II secretion system protein GspC n=1 Tax=Colwellia maritima TaxID=2912588 RepID=A0ABS9WYN8_9GAMM|nr:type II secretion system protein GspC [Colwellia maritima]MCI2282657.1 type II secretion system protein GspC [Colwellia maritima]
MALTNNLTSFSAAVKLPQQKIAQALSVLLLIYIAFMVAKITWLVAPNSNQVMSISGTGGGKSVAGQSGDKNHDLSKLQALNLFGKYTTQEKEVVVEQITNAPETRLQLTLSGLVASDDAKIAAAIIENKGKQETYGIGDIIKDTRASLEQVLIDRVIIKQSGRAETLMLDGADYNQPAQTVSHKQESTKQRATQNQNNTSQQSTGTTTNVVDQRSNKSLSESAQQLRIDLNNDPGKITDYLRISPARKAGEIVGYRLSPGKNPDFFNLSGLKSGDVAVQMNGYNLLAPLEAAQAMSALKTERDITLLVDRNSDLIQILFSIE